MWTGGAGGPTDRDDGRGLGGWRRPGRGGGRCWRHRSWAPIASGRGAGRARGGPGARRGGPIESSRADELEVLRELAERLEVELAELGTRLSLLEDHGGDT